MDRPNIYVNVLCRRLVMLAVMQIVSIKPMLFVRICRNENDKESMVFCRFSELWFRLQGAESILRLLSVNNVLPGHVLPRPNSCAIPLSVHQWWWSFCQAFPRRWAWYFRNGHLFLLGAAVIIEMFLWHCQHITEEQKISFYCTIIARLGSLSVDWCHLWLNILCTIRTRWNSSKLARVPVSWACVHGSVTSFTNSLWC